MTKAPPISLRRLLRLANVPHESWQLLVDPLTGDLAVAPPAHHPPRVPPAECECGSDDTSDGMVEELCAGRGGVIDTPGQPPALVAPNRFDLDEVELRAEYRAQLPPGRLRDDLGPGLLAQGAGDHFHRLLWQHGAGPDWEQFRERALADRLVAWLEANGIAFDRDCP